MTDRIKRQDLSRIALSDFQRESIFNALCSLEENLWQLDSLLLGYEENRILHRRRMDLTLDHPEVDPFFSEISTNEISFVNENYKPSPAMNLRYEIGDAGEIGSCLTPVRSSIRINFER